MPDRALQEFQAGPLRWTDTALWNQFDVWRRADADAIAVIDRDDRGVTRGELSAMALEIAAALRDAGVRPRDRVLLRAPKQPNTVAAALAISEIGAIICPVAPDLGMAERQRLEDRLGHAAAVVATGSNLCVEATAGSRRSADSRDAVTALIGFTSGSTGVPKAVMHSFGSLNYATRACAWVAKLEPGRPILGVVPLGSAPGFTFTAHFALSLGHPLMMVDPWDPIRCLQRAKEHQCIWGMCVPTHVNGMIEAARAGSWTERTNSLRALAVGGSSMTPELVSLADELLGITVLRMFGMSECMGHASTLPDDTLERRLHCDGKSFPGTSDEAFDEQERVLPRGRRGQAGVRGPSLFLGYCNEMGDERSTFTSDGYFLTGDEIVCDADGYVKVVGRIKELIIRGGYNISPVEVEAAILKLPAIAQAAVVPVPDGKLGERACALCVVRPGFAKPNLAALTADLANGGLSKTKWPEYLLLVDELHYTPTDKIDRKRLAQIAARELGLA